MKKILSFSLFIFGLAQISTAQQGPLPSNPKPGMCYIRCVEEDLWKEKKVELTKVPGYTALEKIPAVFKTIEVQVMVKPASKRLEIIPAVFKTVSDTIEIVEANNNLTIIPTVLTNSIEEVISQPAFARFESRSSVENCKSQDPRDCEVLCYVEYPEHKTPVSVQKISSEAKYVKNLVPRKTKIITKQVLVSDAKVKEIEVPAVYRMIPKRVLVSDDTVREIKVAPQYENVTTRVLEKQGGVSSWEEISCKLTSPNLLPIYYNLNSAALTPQSRAVINEKVYNLMIEKPRIKVEISSHTDSRDSDDYNQELSQRRAQSVVDYLISKGIKSNRLVAKGYGETRLIEPCPNGVPCTEAQHAKNRRTEFRVLAN